MQHKTNNKKNDYLCKVDKNKAKELRDLKEKKLSKKIVNKCS